MKKPEKPTMKNAILAHCHNCSHYYLDGREDCENIKCEFYSWMPYAKGKADLEWMEHNPRKKGVVRWEDCKSKEMSPEHLVALKRGREKYHQEK